MGTSLRVQARSNRFDETDPIWLAQADELLDVLEGRGVAVSREHTGGPGHKGAVTTIVLGSRAALPLATLAAAKVACRWRVWTVALSRR
ncbi:hypothetical protein [Phytohabitans aurantiacus]|uniref:Uncharacterized protein n=1 Tax=Phytohabitans aurantiacus TaxID=3016789 RepID=A0ABQ5R4I5_9ACTN|nr:hypothetical protein [Phytohabitans aurantiacus]GLI01315.1 hypothetical protein Pa4123_65910 [Phytohabitans aurantiacus]